jgi:hypothetical protein
MHAAMERNMPGKTGRTLADWAALVKAAGITDWKKAQEWLKCEHGLSTMYAYMVAGAACEPPGGTDYTDETKLLADMYSGPRAALRSIHDTLWELAQRLGPEVQLIVCKTYVSFRARTQFAVVKPTTQTAVDLGLALPPDTPYGGRLEAARHLGGGERNRHRIRLASVKELDIEVKRWLRAAYDWDITRGKKWDPAGRTTPPV